MDVALLAPTDRVVLTYYDDATGERTELTARVLGGWVARTARLLREGCGLGVGSRAAVLLPPHWQTAAVLLGAWTAGVAVSFRPRATAGLTQTDRGPFDAVFVARDRVDNWIDEVPEAPYRFALPFDPSVPVDYRDYVTEVSRYAREPLPDDAGAGHRTTDAASPDGTTYREWSDLAHGIAERQGLGAGDRILVDAGEHEQPVTWLLAPFSAGASVVLCANLDRRRLDDRVRAESITRVL